MFYDKKLKERKEGTNEQRKERRKRERRKGREGGKEGGGRKELTMFEAKIRKPDMANIDMKSVIYPKLLIPMKRIPAEYNLIMGKK